MERIEQPKTAVPLTSAILEIEAVKAELAEHEKQSAERTAELKRRITASSQIVEMSTAGVDLAVVAEAEKLIYVRGQYANAGQDRASCVSDAIKQLATGKPVGGYKDLWRQYFGTKSYDRWHGQRSDHEYGYGPSHGSTIFAIGLTKDAVKRQPSDLSPAEIEAAIYYLTHLERIQCARAKAEAA